MRHVVEQVLKEQIARGQGSDRDTNAGRRARRCQMPKGHFSCSWCGEKVEFSTEEPPCKALTGWLVVSQWKGLRSVDHYCFCSSICLRRWASAQAPEIPDVFLRAFGEERGGGNTRP